MFYSILRVCTVFVLIGMLLSTSSCKKEMVETAYYPREDHSSYVESLRKLHLSDAALGQDWIDAAGRALDEPLDIELPYREEFYLPPTGAASFGYRMDILQGQRLEISVEPLNAQDGNLFIDLFRQEASQQLRHIATAASEEKFIAIETRTDAVYILRIQPELLRGGKYKVDISVSPSLAFPVEGKSQYDIQSFFGDPRDGGRRKHHGVDIFASRHTPVVAPAEGTVRFAGERGLGGRVVWLQDSKRDQTLYFAHLHDIFVHRGQKVSPGDTIGTVGNTGNARTTPPHLHFGIYKSGPQDPFHYIAAVQRSAKKVMGNSDKLGLWMRTQKATALRDPFSGNASTLNRHQMVHLIAATSASYRVSLPDGRTGFIRYSDLEDLISPVAIQDVSRPVFLLESPIEHAPDIKRLSNGVALQVHGFHEDFSYVSDETGNRGWVMAP